MTRWKRKLSGASAPGLSQSRPVSGVMSSSAVLARLSGLRRFGVRLGLERIEGVLRRLGRPQDRLPTIHLAGTNGKGSTAAMIACCLERSGLRTGLFTSPHLLRFSERIQISGGEIGEQDLARWVERVTRLEPELTFFEVATAVALGYFAEQGVDCAVLETGLGGRLDATNVVRPVVVALTSIDLDHTAELGADRASVAREKAGVIKRGVPVVAAAAAEAAREVIAARCGELCAPLTWVEPDDPSRPPVDGQAGFAPGDGDCIIFRGVRWRREVRVPLLGVHQRLNAAVALATLERLSILGWPVDLGSVDGGLAGLRWPGRMEWIDGHLLDCAHNPAAVRSLAASLDRGDFCLVFGHLQGKPGNEMVEPLLCRCRHLIWTRPSGERAADPLDLARELGQGEVIEPVSAALDRARELSGPTLVTGSTYLVGEVRAALTGRCGELDGLSDPGPR